MLILLILQTAVISRLPLLHGTADVILVSLAGWALNATRRDTWVWTAVGGGMVSYVSALPLGLPLATYILTTIIARFFKRMVWQAPILAMIVVVFLGTLISQGLAFLVLQFGGANLPLSDTLSQVVMPSLLLNLLLSLPIYILTADAMNWLYPAEINA